jgi:phosphate transport system substrate-binding protein
VRRSSTWIVVTALAVLAVGLSVEILRDEDLAARRADGTAPQVDPVAGTLTAVGSDAMEELFPAWEAGLRRRHPALKIVFEGKGSITAPRALLRRTADVGAMSRELKPAEREELERSLGYPPTAVPVALQMVAVVVSPDNPLPRLSLAEVDAIFGKSRKGGAAKDVAAWGDLGLSGTWANEPIRLHGRDWASATCSLFRERALFKGDLKNSCAEHASDFLVLQSVAVDRTSIGYVSATSLADGVRAVPLSWVADRPPAHPRAEEVLAGTYPLGRRLWLYVNRRPETPLVARLEAFLRHVLGTEGQEAVERSDFVALPTWLRTETMRHLGISGDP